MTRMYQRKRSLCMCLLMPFMALLVVAGIFGIVRIGSGIRSLEYEIGELEAKRVASQKETTALEAQLSSLLSINRVDTQKLGLAFPERTSVVFVKHDTETAGVRYASMQGGMRMAPIARTSPNYE